MLHLLLCISGWVHTDWPYFLSADACKLFGFIGSIRLCGDTTRGKHPITLQLSRVMFRYESQKLQICNHFYPFGWKYLGVEKLRKAAKLKTWHRIFSAIDLMKRALFSPPIFLSLRICFLSNANQIRYIHETIYHLPLKLGRQQVRSGVFVFCFTLRSKSQTWDLSWLTLQVNR